MSITIATVQSLRLWQWSSSFRYEVQNSTFWRHRYGADGTFGCIMKTQRIN